MTDAAPRATRPTRGRVVSGVSIGLAQHLRIPTWVVRVAFVILAFASGIGVVLYAAFWAVLPLVDGGSGRRSLRGTIRRHDAGCWHWPPSPSGSPCS